jgi:hypothetical protein
MAGPEDHDFDDNGKLRNISESWAAYQDSLSNLPGALRDDDEEDDL